MLSIICAECHCAEHCGSVYREIGYLQGFVYVFVGWHASADCLPLGDIKLAQLACHLNGIIFVYIRS